MKDRIPGGYYIKARVIKNKRIAHSPPHFREIWEYLLREANHKAVQYGRYLVERGQLFRTYKEIRDDLCWFAGYRKVTYSENQTKKAMMALREYQMIATKKEPGGVLITVLNYDFYQDPSNYEGTNESTNGSTNGGTNKEPSLNANNKNEKNVKKEEIIKAVIDFFNFTTGKKFSHKNKEINKLISGRTNDGFSVEDFKTVILTKFTHWKDDDRNKQYITPNTLFRPSHFETYLNQDTPLTGDADQDDGRSKLERMKEKTRKLIDGES